MRIAVATLLLTATTALITLPACESWSGNDNNSSDSRNAHLGRIDGTWKLTHINGNAISVPSGNQTPTLVLSNGGNLTGNTGLNSMSGTYTTKGRYADNITFSPIATTKMAGGRDAMDLERRYNEALSRVDTARVEGDRLILKDGDNQVLRFTRAN